MVGFGGQSEQGVLDHHPGVIAGNMRKLKAASHITDGENFRVRRPQAVIHLDPTW